MSRRPGRSPPSCDARNEVLGTPYLALRGRCRYCRAPISARYPIVEVLGGLLAAYAVWRFGATLRT